MSPPISPLDVLPGNECHRRAEPFFKGFIAPQDIADTSSAREVIVGLSTESREEVDDLADKALDAGGRALGEPLDDGFMYMRGFLDLYGHQWSFLHMDLSTIPEG